MADSSRVREHFEHIDLQILRLLKERVRWTGDARNAGMREPEEETVEFWAEEGEELGLDVDELEKVARAIVLFSRKSAEE